MDEGGGFGDCGPAYDRAASAAAAEAEARQRQRQAWPAVCGGSEVAVAAGDGAAARGAAAGAGAVGVVESTGGRSSGPSGGPSGGSFGSFGEGGGLARGLVCSGSEDARAYVWSVAHGRLVKVLAGHGDVVSSVAWSPRVPGLVATASDDFTVRIWGRASHRARYFHPPHPPAAATAATAATAAVSATPAAIAAADTTATAAAISAAATLYGAGVPVAMVLAMASEAGEWAGTEVVDEANGEIEL